MNKTDTLMWLMRAHEAIRKLPEGTDINSVAITLYGDGNRINIYLDAPVELKGAVCQNTIRYTSGTKPLNYGRVEVSDCNGIDYWWGVEFNEDGTIKKEGT